MKIAIYQPALGGSEPAQRLERLAAALADPAAAKADLLVCPELFMSGYAIGEALHRFAEPADGPFAAAVARLAKANGKAILYGYPERDGRRIYNSAICFGPQGERLANHRKLVLPPGFETQIFARGDALTFFTLGGLKFGLLVCYDAEFPEAVRAMALNAADVVIAPTALKDIWKSVATRMIPTRAFENGVYMVYVNHAGREGDVTYYGGSCITGPDGEDVIRAGSGEQVLAAEIDPAAVAAARKRLPYLEDRGQMDAALKAKTPNRA
jgi:predicted amidohydrolase